MDIKRCGGCESDQVLYTKQHQSCVHHGKFTCAACGRHLTWVSKKVGHFLDRLTIVKGGDTDDE